MIRRSAIHASRNRDQVDAWRREGKDAVHLDLDDPRTFPEASRGWIASSWRPGTRSTWSTRARRSWMPPTRAGRDDADGGGIAGSQTLDPANMGRAIAKMCWRPGHVPPLDRPHPHDSLIRSAAPRGPTVPVSPQIRFLGVQRRSSRSRRDHIFLKEKRHEAPRLRAWERPMNH